MIDKGNRFIFLRSHFFICTVYHLIIIYIHLCIRESYQQFDRVLWLAEEKEEAQSLSSDGSFAL